jgi:hypothetical protein
MTACLYVIERAAIEAIIHQHPSLADALARQLAGATVSNRHNTGAGFYTDLNVSDDTPLVVTPSPIGESSADVAGLQHGMGFLLMIRDGRMVCLEGYSFEDHTPPIDFQTVKFSMTPRPIL